MRSSARIRRRSFKSWPAPRAAAAASGAKGAGFIATLAALNGPAISAAPSWPRCRSYAACCDISGLGSVASEVGFFEMGFDSLMSVKFRARLEETPGKELSSTLAFDIDNPSVDKMADHFMQDVAELTAGHQPAADAAPVVVYADGVRDNNVNVAVLGIGLRMPAAPPRPTRSGTCMGRPTCSMAPGPARTSACAPTTTPCSRPRAAT